MLSQIPFEFNFTNLIACFLNIWAQKRWHLQNGGLVASSERLC